MASDGFHLPLTKYAEDATIHKWILWVLWWHQELLKSNLRSVNTECDPFPRQNIKSCSHCSLFSSCSNRLKTRKLFGVPWFHSSCATSLCCMPLVLFAKWPKISLCGYCKDLRGRNSVSSAFLIRDTKLLQSLLFRNGGCLLCLLFK